MIGAIRDSMSSLRAAITFLTRVPLGPCSCTPPSGAAGFFPLVGTMLGAIGVIVWHLSYRFDANIRAWLVIIALLLLTGAFHEDGLADTADALGGALDRKKLFEILKDSRIGTFGALALICVVTLRASLLGHLLREGSWPLIASQTLSRLSPVLLMRYLPYVTPTGSRSQSVTRVTMPAVILAGLWSAAVAAAIVLLARVSIVRITKAVVALGAMTAWLSFRFARRAGGITGDFLGATQQLSELVFLLALDWTR